MGRIANFGKSQRKNSANWRLRVAGCYVAGDAVSDESAERWLHFNQEVVTALNAD